MCVYRYGVSAGQMLTVTVTPLAGDPDLYVWPPDFPNRPPWVSNLASGPDQVFFRVPVSGIYQIEVYGYTSADYRIMIATGPAGAQVNMLQEAAGAADEKPVRPAPELPVDSQPGSQIALPAPTLPEYRLYLPVVLRW